MWLFRVAMLQVLVDSSWRQPRTQAVATWIFTECMESRTERFTRSACLLRDVLAGPCLLGVLESW